MSRFYFHTEDGRLEPDRDGVELADLGAARVEAIRALGEMLKERADDFWADGVLRMTVADHAGLTLFLLEVTATVAPAAA